MLWYLIDINSIYVDLVQPLLPSLLLIRFYKWSWIVFIFYIFIFWGGKIESSMSLTQKMEKKISPHFRPRSLGVKAVEFSFGKFYFKKKLFLLFEIQVENFLLLLSSNFGRYKKKVNKCKIWTAWLCIVFQQRYNPIWPFYYYNNRVYSFFVKDV